MIEVRELTNDYGDKRVVNRLSTRARCTADDASLRDPGVLLLDDPV